MPIAILRKTVEIESIGSSAINTTNYSTMANPFTDLPQEAFWRPAVASRSPFEIEGLWKPKWAIGPQTRIATFGSCFAQHFGAALRARDFAWVNGEPAPAPLPSDARRCFGYDIFSARTGNIYTARQLRQWLSWALDPASAPAEIWTSNGRYYDPFRPNIEPDGFRSAEEVADLRAATFLGLRNAIERSDVFVFTLGLTESWRNAEHGYHYQSCPGTLAGEYDSRIHSFSNQSFAEISDDIEACLSLLTRLQPEIKLLLTVSPVPLTATSSGNHVLVATSHSKSILRGVAGETASRLASCDYFPSYELITGAPFRSMFFEPNLRNVTSFGVQFVMDYFFRSIGHPGGESDRTAAAASPGSQISDPLCDEAALDRYAGQ